jgi:chlorite dismutase
MATTEELKLQIKADVAEAISNLKKFDRQTQETGKGNQSLGKTFAAMRDVMQGPIAAAKMVGDVLGDLAKVGGELYMAFAEDELATVRLNAALDNASQISVGAGDRFTEFAESLKQVSIYGDDVTKTQIAELAAMGKSEDQIKELITAAADLASATGVDLDTAVKQLNATLNGNAGILGRQNGAVKALTVEQLKNGDAIKVVGEQYKGFAQKVADSAFGEVKQFNEAWGDVSETIGGIIASNFKPMIENAKKAVIALNEGLTAGKTRDAILNGEKVSLTELDNAYKYFNKTLEENKKMAASFDPMSLTGSDYASRVKKDKELLDKIEKGRLASGYSMMKQAIVQEEEKNNAIIADNKKTADELAKIANDKVDAMGTPSQESIDMLKKRNLEYQLWLQTGKELQAMEDLDTMGTPSQEALDMVAQLNEDRAEYNASTDEAIEKTQFQIELEKMLAEQAMSSFASMSEALGAALVTGEDGWKAFGKAGLDAVAGVLEGMAKMWAVQGAADLLIPGMEISGIGLLAAALAGYTAAGAIRAIPMAEGGSGIVTKPTLFLAGEAGPEPYAFGGANNKRGMGMGVIINQNIGGSVVTEDYLTDRALQAVALANRGY